MQLTTILLHGELAEKFGPKWILDVKSPAEAIRAIEANQPGLIQYLAESGDRGIDFAVQVNSREITEELLTARRGCSVIEISPVVRGSKSKWAGVIIGVVLIAVAVVTQQYWAASWLGKATIFGVKATSVIGMIGLSMAIGGAASLIAGQPKGSALDTGEEKASYIFNGPATTTGQGGAVPIVYGGPILVGPTVISQAIHSEDLNAAQESGTPTQGYDEGEGSYTRDTDYGAYDPMTDPVLPTNPQGRSLQARQVAKVLGLICEGEIAGPCDADGNLLDYEDRNKAILFDGTPAQNADGTMAFQRIATTVRNGTASQDWIPGFPAAETTVSVEQEVIKGSDKWANAVQRSIAAGSHNALRITIRIPALYKYDTKGNRSGSAVHFGILIKRPADSTWSEVVGSNQLPDGTIDGLIQGEALQAYVHDFRIPLPDSGAWDVRVVKESADSANPSTHQCSVVWQSYALIVDQKFTYRHSALLAWEVDAQYLGRIPDAAIRIKGMLVRIPSNYNPVTRKYTGVWDGIWTTTRYWTDNPAFHFYDICTARRYGLGKYIDADAIDKWALYEIARYCDAVDSNGDFVGIPDGNGGYEPRFRQSIVLNSTADAPRVLADMASNFRAMIYQGAGLISLVQDAPKTPVFSFTNANVADGIFSYSGTSRKARHTVANVKWNDPRDYYRLKPEPYEWLEGIEKYGIREIDTVAYGSTWQSQTQRHGKWIVMTEWYEKELVTFRTGFEGARVRPGMIIQVRDRDRTVNRMAGRVMALGSGTITLDAPVILDASVFTLTVTKTDGTLADLVVTNSAGTHTVITTSSSLTGIVAGTVWVLRSPALVPEQFRVLNVRELDRHMFEVAALNYVPSKHAAVDSGAAITALPTSDLPTADKPAAPTSVAIELRRVGTPSGSQRFLHVSWARSASDYVASYLVEYRPPNAPWRTIETAVTTLTVPPILVTELGVHSVRVFARSSVDRLSEASDVATITVAEVAATDLPAVFTAAARPEAIELEWENPTDIDFAFAELWMSETDDFLDAELMWQGTATRFLHTGVPATESRWYWIRWRNRTGIYTAYVGPETAEANSSGGRAGDLVAYAFIRSVTVPAVPTGGTYASPVPTSSPTWEDGIPAGTDPLWMTKRKLTVDLVGQDATWSNPVLIEGNQTSPSNIEIKFSEVISSPGTPASDPGNWGSTATTATIWMATRTFTYGTWSSWAVVKVKGETGVGSVTLVARGTAVLVGSNASKPTGSAAWDSDVYSSEGYVGGAYCAFSLTALCDAAAGLNTDPLTNLSNTSLDYSFRLWAGGQLDIVESNSTAVSAISGGYSTSTVLAITYDGANVRYLRDGTVVRTVAASAGLKLHFDSSIYTVGGGFTNIVFGPMGGVGTSGSNGLNNAAVTLFKRAASAPAVPTTTSTYTFSNGTLSGHDNGWSQTQPATNGQPLWAIAATASATGATDTIATGEWSTAVKILEDGSDGLGAFTPLLAGTASLQGTSAYKLTGSSAWDSSVYSQEGFYRGATMGAKVGALGDIAFGLDANPTSSANNTSIDYSFRLWSGGQIDIVESGSTVASAIGTQVANTTVFQITYDNASVRYYVDGVLKRTSTVAADQTLSLDSSFFTVNASNPLLTNISFASFGAAGAAGLNVAPVFLYQRAASVPAVPSVSSTYTFSNSTLTGHNNGWTQTIPAGSNPIYVTTATAASTGATDTITSGEWATPQILAQNGATGASGPGYAATSTTSLTYGVGARSLTTQTGLAYAVGSRIRVTKSSDITQWMEGLVTSYTTGTGALNFTSELFVGSGSNADWTLSLAGLNGTGGDPEGEWVSGRTYKHDSIVRSLVWKTVSGTTTFYLANNPSKNGQNTWGDPASSSDWISAGTTRKFTATAMALLEDATVLRTMIIGDGTTNAGIIRSATATAYMTGTGAWRGYDGTVYKERVGNPSGYYQTFDTSTGEIVQNIKRIIVGDPTAANDGVGELQIVGEGSFRKHGSGAQNVGLSGTVAQGTIGTPSATAAGSFVSMRLRGYDGGAYVTPASIRLKAQAGFSSGITPTEMEFIVANSAGANQYMYLSKDGELQFAGTTATRDNAALKRGGTNLLECPGTFKANAFQQTYFEAGVTTAVDVKDANLRVYNGGSQTARIDFTTGRYYINGTAVLNARWAGATPSSVADLWTVMQHHGLG